MLLIIKNYCCKMKRIFSTQVKKWLYTKKNVKRSWMSKSTKYKESENGKRIFYY